VLRNKYYSADEIREDELSGTCGPCGGEEKCMQDFCGQTWPGRHRGRWNDNIKMHVTCVGRVWAVLIWSKTGKS